MPMLVVDRAEPEGVRVKTTKSDRSRRVPIADRVLPLIRACAEGRGPDERLFMTESGHRLHATALKRTLAWPTVAEGRRIHDLRHTAACLAGPPGRRGYRPGLDGACVGGDDEPLLAPPGYVGRQGRTGASEPSGAHWGHKSGRRVGITRW